MSEYLTRKQQRFCLADDTRCGESFQLNSMERHTPNSNNDVQSTFMRWGLPEDYLKGKKTCYETAEGLTPLLESPKEQSKHDF